MKIAFIIFALFFLFSLQVCKPIKRQIDLEKKEYVILLHGLTRSSRSMARMEKNLSKYRYNVINIDYPSTKYPLEYLAEETLNNAIYRHTNIHQSRINFVTHSIGGIIVRYYLKRNKLLNLGRVVMLSPPNQGSELVDFLKNNFIFKIFNGPAGQQLGTDKDSIPLNLGPVNFELGVITGNRSLNPISSMMIPGPDDGSVSVERAKVAGMRDFLVLPHSHTFIMQSKAVIDQVIYFLEHGEFRH